MENKENKVNYDTNVSFRDVQEYRKLIDLNPDLAVGLMRYGPAKLADAERFVELVNAYRSYDYKIVTRLCEGRDILDKIQRHALSCIIDSNPVPYKDSHVTRGQGNPRTSTILNNSHRKKDRRAGRKDI